MIVYCTTLGQRWRLLDIGWPNTVAQSLSNPLYWTWPNYAAIYSVRMLVRIVAPFTLGSALKSTNKWDWAKFQSHSHPTLVSELGLGFVIGVWDWVGGYKLSSPIVSWSIVRVCREGEGSRRAAAEKTKRPRRSRSSLEKELSPICSLQPWSATAAELCLGFFCLNPARSSSSRSGPLTIQFAKKPITVQKVVRAWISRRKIPERGG